MAGIIEAFDSSVKEAFAGIKILVWGVPVCITASLFMTNPTMAYIIGTITAVIFIGFLTQSCNNVITKKDKILPGLNILSYSLVGIVTVITMSPFALLAGLVEYAVLNFINMPSPVWDLTFKIVGSFLAISVILASYVIYIRRLNPIEAYNMRKYFIGFGEVFLSFSYLIVKLTLWSCVIIGFLVYLFSLFIGFQNVIWTYILSSVFVLYFVLGANYVAQISEEVFTFVEKKDNEKKENEIIEKMQAQ